MIKYFQKLKAKKGFTLVELIVVIAIIGVLAAILIPTMLGYVTQSKVTSANSTAASIKNEIDAFLTNLDTIDKGMKKGSVTSVLSVQVSTSNSTTTWAVSNETPASFNDQTNWTTAASATTASNDTTTKGATNHLAGLAADLRDLFPEVKTGALQLYLQGGKCIGVIYNNGSNVLPKINASNYLNNSTWNGVWPTGAAWSNGTAGIGPDGSIIGTAPVIPLADKEQTATAVCVWNADDAANKTTVTVSGSQAQNT